MQELPNILIVDDTSSNIKYLEMVLKALDVNLIEAASGSEALEKAKDVNLALAILDVQMPEMNGYELALLLNKERSGDKVPLIFLTASQINDQEVFKGYGSGAVDYIFKPINNNILVSKTKIFLELFEQKQKIINDAILIKKTSDELVSINAALAKSEEKYRSYIDNAPDCVFVTDEIGKIIEVNEAALRLSGYSKNDLLKMSFEKMLLKESINVAVEQFKKVMETGFSKSDLLFEQKNGKKRWIDMEVVKLPNFRLLAFAKDITKRKEMEESLRNYQIELEMQNQELLSARDKAQEASAKYTTLYDFAPSGFFTLTKEGEIHELNLSGAYMLGKDRSQLRRAIFGSYLSSDTRALFNLFLKNVFDGKTKEICEMKFESDRKPPKYVHIEGVNIGDGKHCLINAIDITDRKKDEADVYQAKNLLDLIIENIPNMVFLKDAKDLQFVRINRAGEELLGILKERLIGKNDYDFFPKKQADSFIENDKNVLLYKDMIDISEEFIDTKYKGLRTLHTKKVPILNNSGEPEYLLGISEDITEQKIAAQAMKISEEKYRTMLNASPDGILLINLKGIITEVSEIGLELFGANARNEMVGKHFILFVPQSEKNIIKEIINKTILEGLAQNIELKIKKKNQSIFLSEISSTLIQDPDGAPLSFMIILRDISQRKKMETKQSHADRMANLGEMASGIAHEINQPLNIISMVVDKILFETDKTETINIEFLKIKSEKIFDNITRIRNIIDHIRAFSRVQDDYLLTTFDINSSIKNATSMIGEQLKHLGINLILQLGTHVPKILGNTYKFEQVIINVLSNAKDAVLEKKAISKEDYQMSVEIKTYKENESIIVEVTDNGIGINEIDINNIILPFYTTKTEGKGTGLGLSICYQIVKEMGGIIDITSKNLLGTKIKLVLDIKKKK
ncbi:MAG: PAS domain S-box protein [bacterium]